MDIKNGLLVPPAVLSASLLSACGGGSGSSDSQSSLPDFELPSPAAGVSGNNPVGLWVGSISEVVRFSGASFNGTELAKKKFYFTIQEKNGFYYISCSSYLGLQFDGSNLKGVHEFLNSDESIREEMNLVLSNGSLSGRYKYIETQNEGQAIESSDESITAVKLNDTASFSMLSEFTVDVDGSEYSGAIAGDDSDCFYYRYSQLSGSVDGKSISGEYRDLDINIGDLSLKVERDDGNLDNDLNVFFNSYLPYQDLNFDCDDIDCSKSMLFSEGKDFSSFSTSLEGGSERLMIMVNVEH